MSNKHQLSFINTEDADDVTKYLNNLEKYYKYEVESIIKDELNYLIFFKIKEKRKELFNVEKIANSNNKRRKPRRRRIIRW